MNQQDNRELNNESIVIEDLSAQNAEEIKGGPSTQSHRDVILKTSATQEQSEDNNTQPGIRVNHNETVAADEEASDSLEAQTASLADLQIIGEEEQQVKGGPYSYSYIRSRPRIIGEEEQQVKGGLPAVQKV